MFDLPHEHARTLIQSAADQMIDPESRTALDAHLAQCKECRAYARSLANLEASLRTTLHARWDRRRPTLNLYQILNPSPVKIIASSITNLSQSISKATVMVALFLGCVALASHFSFQIPNSHKNSPTTIPTPNEDAFFLLASPTPSAPIQKTQAGQSTQVCPDIVYYVHTTDTVENIAIIFGVSKELILEHNELITDIVSPGMKLHIPQCNNTPAYTASVPYNYFTITPGNVTLFLDGPD